ncbi:monocarboxylate transporter 12-B-like [Genypterus blacodes]|uniref:monocarboxylate transporter 12-B-like n=1 Tax=Genypterus blacodes TaxID=154954 RepID=UPI003F776087
MAATKGQTVRGRKGSSRVTDPPEGSWGWMVVAGCFLATICIRAVTRCVSMFFVEFQLHFERDYSTTSWIHSLIDCTTMLCAPLGSYIGNRFSCRATIMLGGLLSSAGLVLSSFATSLEYLYMSLGILTGLGFALCYTPAIAMVGTYFDERKALAYGIALSGCGIGTFALAPAVQLLIKHYSWRGALLILGGFVSNLCVCGALMRPLEPPQNKRKWENSVETLQSECYLTAVLDSSDLVAPKQLEVHMSGDLVLHMADETLKHRKLEVLRSSSTNLSEPRLAEVNLADCIVFTNTLTEKMLREIKLSDPKLADGATMEDLKLLENMKKSNKGGDVMDAEIVKQEDARLVEAQQTDKAECSLPAPLLRTKTLSWTDCLCLKSRQEFGFLKMPDFLILAVSFLFMAYGCSAPVVYLVPYALSVGVEHQQAAFLMSIFGICGIVGNITFGWITDRKCLRKYRLVSYMGAVAMEGLCCMFVPLLSSFTLLVPFSVLYGYFDGAYVALLPVVTSDIVGSRYLTSALGVVFFLHAVPYLVSPPIGGWLVDRTGDYAATFFLSGGAFMFSSIFLATAMSVRRCQKSSHS